MDQKGSRYGFIYYYFGKVVAEVEGKKDILFLFLL